MIGLLIQLAISWLLIWFFEKGNLSVLGFMPTKKRLRNFGIFFFITTVCAATGFLLKWLIAKQSWMFNPAPDAILILEGVWFTVKSVLFEELIFRGVLLYILIRKLGATWAIVISSCAFGVYHWFSHELWGNPGQMAFEFFGSGAMGMLLAYGYAKTFSLYIPVAIHLGWNLVQMVVFSGNTIGDQLLVERMPRLVVTISYFSFYFMLFFPIVICLLINGWLLKRLQQDQLPEVRGNSALP